MRSKTTRRQGEGTTPLCFKGPLTHCRVKKSLLLPSSLLPLVLCVQLKYITFTVLLLSYWDGHCSVTHLISWVAKAAIRAPYWYTTRVVVFLVRSFAHSLPSTNPFYAANDTFMARDGRSRNRRRERVVSCSCCLASLSSRLWTGKIL